MYTTLVTTGQLNQHLDEWLVLDCRFDLADPDAGRRAYAAGHIPGAFFLHQEDDLSSVITEQTGRHPLPDPNRLANRLAALGLSEGRQVVVYDDMGGAMAGRLWWLLRWLGHDAVALLDGGFPAWLGDEMDVSKKPVMVQSGNFEYHLRPEMTLSVDDIQQQLYKPHLTLVDARAEARFLGEQEPIDPVAGHIPGALNRPLMDNLVDGRFKPAGVLHAEWTDLLAGRGADQVVHMCGSGITACHNQLAMEVAGLTGSRLYPGSWSEWIRDPARPVATA
ncbi:MAG: sulfurtransferase [Marinobacterium sp.]|nr:sulfurtransferase [Marinobacterium sp.]